MKKRFSMLIWIFLAMQWRNAKFGTCAGEDQNCLSCDDDGKCLLCVHAYPDRDGVCQPISTIPNCLIYDTDKDYYNIKCDECNLGYKKDSGACLKIITNNCLHIVQETTTQSAKLVKTLNISSDQQLDNYVKTKLKNQSSGKLFQFNITETPNKSSLTKVKYNSEVCSICSNSILAHSGQCRSGRFCSVEHCEHCLKKYGSQEKCVECKQNFVMLKMWNNLNYCKEITKKTMNCLYMEINLDMTVETCVICRVNFFNSGGSCLRSNTYKVKEYERQKDVIEAGKRLEIAILWVVSLIIIYSLECW